MTVTQKRVWPWLLLAGGILLVALASGRSSAHGPALGPDSTGSDGAKGLRLLLQELGAQVAVGSDAPGPAEAVTSTALVLDDVLGPGARAGLLVWVHSGGTLVLTDPRSPLAEVVAARRPGASGVASAGGELTAGCSLPALARVGSIATGSAPLLKPLRGETVCFRSDDGAFLLARDEGAGTVVVLGGPGLWTNGELDHAGNSVLAAALLAPRRGARVAWMVSPRVGGGKVTLIGLISPRVKEGVIQLVVAFVLVALWRARRLGRPVVERQPVELAGSELVVAVGNLLQQGRRVDQAAQILRADLARDLADRLGVGPGASPEVLAELASKRANIDRDLVLTSLAGSGPRDEGGLLALAQATDAIRREVAHAR